MFMRERGLATGLSVSGGKTAMLATGVATQWSMHQQHWPDKFVMEGNPAQLAAAP